MKIRSLHLKNYKRFADLTIDLGEKPARIVALVGPNGSGKSSVLDAILFSDSHSDIGDSGKRPVSYHKLAGSDSAPSVEVAFIDGDYYSIRAKKLLDNRENTIFSIRSPYRFASGQATGNSDPITMNSYGASDFSANDKKLDVNYGRLFKKYREYMELNDCRPSDARKFIIEELNASIEKCLPIAIESLGEIDAGDAELIFRKQGQKGAFPFSDLSSGEKSVVDILLDLYLRKAAYDDSVFLVDEPELFMDSAVQKKLLREICCLLGQNNQLWITAKSPSLIAALQDEFGEDVQYLFFSGDQKWSEETHVLDPISATRDSWKNIFSDMIEDISSLVVPKCIVYCDGRRSQERLNAERGFDARFYSQVFANKYPDTVFFSSTGGGDDKDSHFVAVTLLQGKNKGTEAIILREREQGSFEKDRMDVLEKSSEGTRVLKRLDIENYLFDKDVLRKYCQANNLRFDEFGYSDYVANIVDQNVRDRTGFIKKFCGITVSLSPAEFKQQLVEYITEDMDIYKELEQVIFERK